MRTVFKHRARQESAVWIVAFTFVVVLLYSFWGASVLNNQREASVQVGGVVAAER